MATFPTASTLTDSLRKVTQKLTQSYQESWPLQYQNYKRHDNKVSPCRSETLLTPRTKSHVWCRLNRESPMTQIAVYCVIT